VTRFYGSEACSPRNSGQPDASASMRSASTFVR
jgi:hypothetical protein